MSWMIDSQPSPSPKLSRTSSRGAELVVEEFVQGEEDADMLPAPGQKGRTGRQKADSVDEHVELSDTFGSCKRRFYRPMLDLRLGRRPLSGEGGGSRKGAANKGTAAISEVSEELDIVARRFYRSGIGEVAK